MGKVAPGAMRVKGTGVAQVSDLVRGIVVSLIVALASGLLAGSIAPPRAAAQAADGRYIVVLRDDAGDPGAAAVALHQAVRPRGQPRVP